VDSGASTEEVTRRWNARLDRGRVPKTN